MMMNRALLRQLEKRIANRPTVAVVLDAAADPVLAWIAAGSIGELPDISPCPSYRSADDWTASHRFVLGLCCALAGRDAELDLSEDERQEIAEAAALLTAVGEGRMDDAQNLLLRDG